MLRLWGVWSASLGACVPGFFTTSDNKATKPYGDFIKVTPEVRAAVKALKSGALTGNPFDAEIARGDIVNWALAGIPEEQGDA